MPERVIPGVGVVSEDLGGLAPQFKFKQVPLTAEEIASVGARAIRHSSAVVVDNRVHTSLPDHIEEVPNPVTLQPAKKEAAAAVVYADRPAPSDQDAMGPDLEIVTETRPVPAVSKPRPLPTPPVKQPVVKQEPEVEDAMLVTQLAPVVPAKVEKKRVQLKSAQIGTIRLRVNEVLVSDTLVVLVYGLDDDNVVEPPPHGSASPLSVLYEEKQYDCLCSGFTAEMGNQLLVVLIRITD